MNKSDTIGALAAALAKAQGQMTFAAKDATNPHFRSKYADLAAVVDAIREPLSSNGLSFSQLCDFTESGGLVVETVLMHESGEWISGRLNMPVPKMDPQGVGSALTYSKRYSLASIVGIAADEDDDGEGAMGRTQQTTQEPKQQKQQQRQPRQQQAPPQSQQPATDLASESQRNLIFAKMKEHGVSGDALKAEFKLTSSKEIKKSQVNDILAWLEKQQPAICNDCRQPVSNHAPSCPQAAPPA